MTIWFQLCYIEQIERPAGTMSGMFEQDILDDINPLSAPTFLDI